MVGFDLIIILFGGSVYVDPSMMNFQKVGALSQRVIVVCCIFVLVFIDHSSRFHGICY